MNTIERIIDLESEVQAIKVWLEDFTINAELIDGRVISVPLAFYPSLLNASKKDRENFKLLGGGIGIHWPSLDLDISTDGLLLGRKETITPFNKKSA